MILDMTNCFCLRAGITKIDFINFIMHKTFATNFKLRRRNLVLHVTCLQIALHIFLYNITAAKKCSSSSMKGAFIFPSITFVMELFVNYLELKESASIGRTTSGSMKVTV
jgi:hypothetical protein